MNPVRTFKATVATHPKAILYLVLLTLFLLGGAGEVAAHNPGGNPVPGCGHMADPALHESGVCHS